MIIPNNPAPIGLQAVGGAAGGVRGYLAAQQQENEQKRRDQLMERDLQEQKRRLHLYDLSSQELDFRIKKFQQEQDQKAQQKQAGAAVNTAMLDLYNAPPEGTPDPNAPQYGDPGFTFDFGQKQDQADDGYFDTHVAKLREAVANGDVAPEVAAQAAQHLGTLIGARKRERGAKRVAGRIHDYIANGFASSGGALGLESDPNGEDPVAKQFNDLLNDIQQPGVDPAMVETRLDFLVNQLDTERNKKLAVGAEADKLGAEFQQQMATAGPEQLTSMLTVMDKLRRGDMGYGAEASKLARAQMAQAAAGTVPVVIGGKLVHASPEDAAAVTAFANKTKTGLSLRERAVATAARNSEFLTMKPEAQAKAVAQIMALMGGSDEGAAPTPPAPGATTAPAAAPAATNGQVPQQRTGTFTPLGPIKQKDLLDKLRDLYEKNDAKGLKALSAQLGELAPEDFDAVLALKRELDTQSKARAGNKP